MVVVEVEVELYSPAGYSPELEVDGPNAHQSSVPVLIWHPKEMPWYQ